jgi:hypothetical protein
MLQPELLSFNDWFAQLNQCAVRADNQRVGALGEGCVMGLLSGNEEGDKRQNPLASPLLHVWVGSSVFDHACSLLSMVLYMHEKSHWEKRIASEVGRAGNEKNPSRSGTAVLSLGTRVSECAHLLEGNALAERNGSAELELRVPSRKGATLTELASTSSSIQAFCGCVLTANLTMTRRYTFSPNPRAISRRAR